MLIIEQHRHAWRRARDLQGVLVRILNKAMAFKMTQKKEPKRKKAFSTICFEKPKKPKGSSALGLGKGEFSKG